jgi:hypothetical protein
MNWFFYFLIKLIRKIPRQFTWHFQENLREFDEIIYISSFKIWKSESNKIKLKSILRLNWKPSNDLVMVEAISKLFAKYYGEPNDFSFPIYEVDFWHQKRKERNYPFLTENDKEELLGLESVSILLEIRLNTRENSNVFSLNLFNRHPEICILTLPLVLKLPVRSIKNCIIIDHAYAFNQIRKSELKFNNEIISSLSDLLLTQQKIAFELRELQQLINKPSNNEKLSLLYSDLDAVRCFDLLVVYLKATIEKAMYLLGYIFDISNLEGKKEQKKRLKSLKDEIPQLFKDQFYLEFVFEQLSSEKLEPLNKYRTGLVHKKGISKTKPNNLMNDEYKETLNSLFNFCLERHADNTAMLICIFAVLTDKLSVINPPDFSIEDIPRTFIKEYYSIEEKE